MGRIKSLGLTYIMMWQFFFLLNCHFAPQISTSWSKRGPKALSKTENSTEGSSLSRSHVFRATSEQWWIPSPNGFLRNLEEKWELVSKQSLKPPAMLWLLGGPFFDNLKLAFLLLAFWWVFGDFSSTMAENLKGSMKGSRRSQKKKIALR